MLGVNGEDVLAALTMIAILLAVAVASVVVLWALWVALSVVWRLGFEGRSVAGLWRASYSDVLPALRVIGWSVVGRRAGAPAAGIADVDSLAGADVVVVMLHGTAADGTCMRGWMNALRDGGVEVPVLAPDHGVILRQPAVHGARIAAFLHGVLAAAPQARLVLVAHSMGGVAARWALAHDPVLQKATFGVVTVATPHHGTGLAARVPVGPLGSLSWQSQFLSELPPLGQLVPHVVTFASDVDVIVYPTATCHDDAGAGEDIVGIGHAALLTDRAVGQKVATAVQRLIVDASRQAW